MSDVTMRYAINEIKNTPLQNKIEDEKDNLKEDVFEQIKTLQPLLDAGMDLINAAVLYDLCLNSMNAALIMKELADELKLDPVGLVKEPGKIKEVLESMREEKLDE